MDEGSVWNLYREAGIYYRRGKTPEALGILTRLALLYPRSAKVLHGRALCLLSLRRYDEVLAVCDQLSNAGGDEEANALRQAIAEHQINLALRESLLGNRMVSRDVSWKSRLGRSMVLGLVLACCILMGLFIGMQYSKVDAADMGVRTPRAAGVAVDPGGVAGF